MNTYLVGGAVRDELLGIPVAEKDWVVVGATVEEMLRQNFQQVGKDFPVFLHPQSHEEYALARTERKTGPGYKGFAFNASPDVSLEEDLQRRDLTINAIARGPDGTIIDPYGGSADIRDRVLRHVSPAFREDPLRVLRVARFAARFAQLGFRIADETLFLMKQIVEDGELQHLVPERVWKEMEIALRETAPVVFFQVLRECNALKVILPEVDCLFGVPQPEKYHPEIDTGVHTFMCVEQATRLSDDPVVRYAVLVHDVGKGVTPESGWPSHKDHEKFGLQLLENINLRLRVPREYAEVSRKVCEFHTHMHRMTQLRPVTILSLLEALDGFRRPARVRQFLLACEADARGRTGLEDRPYPQKELLLEAFEAAAAVDVGALLKARHNQDGDIKAFVRQRRIEAIRQRSESRQSGQVERPGS